MDKAETVYDSTEMQLRELIELRGEKLTSADLATPPVIQLLLAQQMRNLADLKAARSDGTELRNTIQRLSNDHAQLRVKLAESRTRQRVLALEIPIGILSGFAINMLTTSKFADLVGWVLLLLSVVMLVMLLAGPKILEWFEKKEYGNGENEN